ncbi:MAG: hypothetical protein U9Q71_02960, partial [Pseudomonadota bacterium]|nr:hypothetical protein [Pseudomonadota bacterium]
MGLSLKPQIIPRDELFALLEEGATVVTGNRRLYREIEAEFERRMQATREAWRTPDVLPFPAWLESNWEGAVLDGAVESPALLLSDAQEQRIWERIVEDISPGLLRVEATAAEAREAWRLVQAWRLPATRAVFSYNEDSQAFWRWQEAFDRHCRRNCWLPRAKLADDLAEGLKHGWEGAPKQLVLIGFDELTPRQQTLAGVLEQAGCSVRWVEPAGRGSISVRSGWPDVRAEVNAACRWARQRLEANPDARIGLVALELGAMRQILTQRLDAVLAPRMLAPAAPESAPRPWNLSLGLPLNQR